MMSEQPSTMGTPPIIVAGVTVDASTLEYIDELLLDGGLERLDGLCRGLRLLRYRRLEHDRRLAGEMFAITAALENVQ